MTAQYGGWRNNSSNSDDYSSSSSNTSSWGNRNDSFSSARDAYSQPAPVTPTPTRPSAQASVPSIVMPQTVDVMPRPMQTTAPNVVILLLDTTGSMSAWNQQIMKDLPLLHEQAKRFMRGDLEIIIASFGDSRLCMDLLRTAPPGQGRVLDTYLDAVNIDNNGGGNGVESAEIAATWVLASVDTSRSQNVLAFVVTDEGVYADVSDNDARTYARVNHPPEKRTKQVFARLENQLRSFVVLCDTETCRNVQAENCWSAIISDKQLIKAPRDNLVVECLLSTISAITGTQLEFDDDFASRRQGTHYFDENRRLVAQATKHIDTTGSLQKQGRPNVRPLL